MDPRTKLMEVIFGPGDHRTERDEKIDTILFPGDLAELTARNPIEPARDTMVDLIDQISAQGPRVDQDVSKEAWLTKAIRRYLLRQKPEGDARFEAPCTAENLDDTMLVRTSWGPSLTNWFHGDADSEELDAIITGPLEIAFSILYEGLVISSPHIVTPAWAMPEWFQTGADKDEYAAGNWLGGLQVITYRLTGLRNGWVRWPMEFEIIPGFEPPSN